MKTEIKRIKTKLNKIKIAMKKARQLQDYVNNNGLGDYESENSISVDSAIYCDVRANLAKEYKRLYDKKESLQASQIKKYAIEYRLHYDKYSFDTISHIFEGKNKTEALKNYNRQTGVPKSRVISVERVDNI